MDASLHHIPITITIIIINNTIIIIIIITIMNHKSKIIN